MKMYMTKKFFNLPLFWQLLLPMMFVVILGTQSALVAVIGNNKIEDLWHTLYEDNMQLVFELAKLDKLYAAHQLTLLKHLTSEDAEDMRYYKDVLTSMQAQIERELERLSEHYGKTDFDYFEAEVLFKELKEKAKSYFATTAEIVWLSEDFEKESALTSIESKMRPLALAIGETASALLDEENQKMRIVYVKSSYLLKHIKAWFIGITVSAILLSVVIALVLSRFNSKRIQAVVDYVEALGKGDLSKRIKVDSSDELARVSHGLNNTAENLKGLILELETRSRALAESEERYALAMQGANDGLWDWNLNTKVVYFSPRWKNMLGYSEHEIGNDIGDWWRRIHRDDIELAMSELRVHLEAITPYYENEHRLRHRDGSYRWVLARGLAVRHADGKPHRIAGSITDITKRREAEDALCWEKELAQVTLASIGDAVITTDATGAVTYLNAGAQKLTGWSTNDAMGRPLLDIFKLIDEATRHALENPFRHVLLEGQNITLSKNSLLIGAQNKEFAIEYSASPIRDRNGSIIGSVLVFRDVSQSRAMAQQILWQASHDPMTGLVNRRQFEHRLEQAIYNAKTYDEHHAVCYLDLDQFKVVNDTCGHIAGDELLRQIGGLLMDRVRETDTLARLGGDEFGVILNHCSIDQATSIANELRELVQEFRFLWDDKPFALGVSIGLVSITQGTEDLMSVLKAADAACYAAKDQGRNRVHIYKENDTHLVRRQGEMQWALQIHEAFDNRRFRLYCQPIVPLGNTPSEGPYIEILVRLLNREGNVVLPGAFISAAERYDLMTAIDRWVVKEAFRYFKHFEKKSTAGMIHTCAINLSGKSVTDKDFLRYIQRRLKRYHVPPQRICFEITETAAIANLSNALNFIKELKNLGCRFALDDFGSGLSSFAYLKNLPVDYLKIDGTFVKDLDDDPIDQAMVQAINNIGHVMGIKTIAEFVETPVIAKRLTALGVDYAQGYSVAEPMPIEDMMSKLEKSVA
jgi:diguanylate cyclase (GGDEF)-like protein/PAS domain S-box-containing protein